ncbi:TetR/AcrR family transcriptional regulator [Methylobacterium terricola]|uniref:TetR/AcrR family transcriptional regulator n=1 Tax=Methylobacterium terricola TaxID=2583531 RepID=UPI001486FF11|nr:TetR/AcrR family transcriptional regulator [Methylobacterium terricola]
MIDTKLAPLPAAGQWNIVAIAVKETTKPLRKGRGRPRQFDRDQAVATALRLFKRHGYEGTSIAHLTDAIGVSATSLYGVFPSKEALFEEAVALYQRTEAAFAAQALDRSPTAYQAIHDLLMAAAASYVDGDRSGGCFISLGVLSCASEHREIAARMAARRVATRAAIKARLDRGRESGELPPIADTDALAGLYAATLQGMSVQARDGASADDLERIARLALVPLDAGRGSR